MNARWLSAPAVWLALVSCHPAAEPSTPTMTTAAAPTNVEKTRALLTAASAGKFDAAVVDFDDTMKKAMPPASFGQMWQQLEGKLGAFERVEKIDTRDETHDGHAFHVAVATTKFAHDRIAFRIPFDEHGRVAGFWIKPVDEASQAWSTPAYATPETFHERRVDVGTSPALPGTLTIPNGAGPFPAVILVHGSGPHDEDETLLGAKPFKDLAWGLATDGVAVLRYAKRTKVSPAGVVTQKEEVIDAVRDAVALLSAASEIDHQRIYVVGHSQGGYLAPRIAEGEPRVRGIAMLAGSTIPLEDSILNQLTYFSSLAPTDETLKKQISAAHAFKAKVQSPTLRADELVTLPIGGSPTSGAYFLDVRDYRPVATASRLSCRILVLQGARDYQVTPREYAEWKAGLLGKNASFHLYPALNHLFMSGQGTPSPHEYARPGQHVDAQVVRDIATWIRT